MRTLALYALLCIRCGAAVWFQEARNAGGSPGPTTCSAHCAQKTERRESRSCPFAKFIEGKYYYWHKYRGCNVQDLMIETTCGGDMRNGGLKAQITKVFGGKHTVMIGDSTMKQTYIGLLCMIWEEGLVNDSFRDADNRTFESKEHDPEKEDHGYINAYMPELGDGTNFTYVRKDAGVPGPLMMSVLDTADITVANLAMHYCVTSMTARCNTEHHYEVEMPLMLSNISKRGRPGHRAFWRDALVCPDYDYNPNPKTYSGYGCVAEPNPTLRMHNSIIAAFPEFKKVEKIPVAELYMPFWWAHPGGHDCCHMVSQMPGLLSATSRVLLAMLSKPAGSPVHVARTDTDSNGAAYCPKMETNCVAERVDLWPM